VTLDPFEWASELAEQARQEIYDRTHGHDAELAAKVRGLATAAAGQETWEPAAVPGHVCIYANRMWYSGGEWTPPPSHAQLGKRRT
jgi:hypothetical protein